MGHQLISSSSKTMKLNSYLSATFIVISLSILGQCQAALAGLDFWATEPLERQARKPCQGRSDGYCDDQNNNIGCEFDGGDCCEQRHDDWNTKCTDCKCIDPHHPKFDVTTGTKCMDVLDKL